MICIKVLGEQPRNCSRVYLAAIEAVSILDCNCSVEYITDRNTISAWGVEVLPAIVINGRPLFCGKELKAHEILYLLRSILHEKDCSC